MSILDKIAIKIIKEQELIVGPLAWSEAGKVRGLKIINCRNGEVGFEDPDQKSVIDRLVNQYSRLFGQASREACKDAVVSLLADLSPAEVPSSLS